MVYLFIISSKWHLDLATEWLHILYPVVTVFVRELPRSQENSIGKTNEGFRAIPMNLRIRKTGSSQVDNVRRHAPFATRTKERTCNALKNKQTNKQTKRNNNGAAGYLVPVKIQLRTGTGLLDNTKHSTPDSEPKV